MKQERKKDEIDFKNNFQNTSQQYKETVIFTVESLNKRISGLLNNVNGEINGKSAVFQV